ncbi:alcohol dehydrogenase catalytic domain-containing protein [Nocardia farcinica]|uniref:alcohol dehydrogenase catalytic domain-containing protein n=1 Tax=Nocardia farcinica TaxID=37329 RepID=UPI0015F071CF|nr:zinc-binding dehydrogenase [Nocardia farcinica]MBA4854153.1 alcohol dehydrogenase catalytic domain-containing protein [Nocardia farcinica]MBC9814338.1 alcohol dehydrogenase catalytic domain-containing protein [Nocardia farcinica]
MRAAVLRRGQIVYTDITEPTPGPGQLLVRPLAVGICGSDLSAWEHTEDFLAAHREADAPGGIFDPDRDVVLGHEFTARVVALGPGVSEYRVGDAIVALPWIITADGVGRTVGYTEQSPGALAERCVVQAGGHLRIPDSIDPVTAAVTEPLATGVNAVLRSGIAPDAAAVVTGCGPVGLGAVLELAVRGAHPIIASDPSARRRALARAYGAHHAVDPATIDPLHLLTENYPARETVVFEASGAHGIIGHLMTAAPAFTRIVIVGSAMRPETIRPVTGILRNVTLEFVGGPGRTESTYTALARTFEHLVERRFDPALMVTGYAGLDAVAEVFAALRPRTGAPVDHVKILVRSDLPDGGGIVAATRTIESSTSP